MAALICVQSMTNTWYRMRRTLSTTSKPLAAPKAPSRWPVAFFSGVSVCLLGGAWYYLSASTVSMPLLAQAMYTATGLGFLMLSGFSGCCAKWEWQKRAWIIQYGQPRPKLLPNRPCRKIVRPSISKAQRSMPPIPVGTKLPEGWELPDEWFRTKPTPEIRIITKNLDEQTLKYLRLEYSDRAN